VPTTIFIVTEPAFGRLKKSKNFYRRKNTRIVKRRPHPFNNIGKQSLLQKITYNKTTPVDNNLQFGLAAPNIEEYSDKGYGDMLSYAHFMVCVPNYMQVNLSRCLSIHLSFEILPCFKHIKKDRSFTKTPVFVRQLFINYLEQTYKFMLSYQNQDTKKKRALFYYYNHKNHF